MGFWQRLEGGIAVKSLGEARSFESEQTQLKEPSGTEL